jgi:glutamate/tyrosine decarboxylase-like PLP-dependent enzyme
MGRQLQQAARASDDHTVPRTTILASYVRRWEAGKIGLTERYRLHYCTALGVRRPSSVPASPTRSRQSGAFGLWASASPRLRSLTSGAELADSVTADAHKWLNVPYDCGIAIVRDPAALSAAMSVTAPYLLQSAGRDPFIFTPEVSRRARALPVYAALRHLGRRGVAEMVERSCELAQLAAVELTRCDRIRVLNEVVLNQVLFGIEGADDSVTAAVIKKVQRNGTCWIGGTQWRDEPAIRFSVSTWSTTRDDISRSVAAIISAVAEVCPAR